MHDLACPSHKTRTEWQGLSKASVQLDPQESDGGNRDFILRYRLAGERIASGLLLYQGQDEGFFLVMAQPPERVAAADVPPREYIFVVDVSGSMAGFPLDTAKKLLRDLIGTLKPTDTFNVLLFSGTSHLMSPRSLPASAANVAAAIRVIDEQRGGGGTELHAALDRALQHPAHGRVRAQRGPGHRRLHLGRGRRLRPHRREPGADELLRLRDREPASTATSSRAWPAPARASPSW